NKGVYAQKGRAPLAGPFFCEQGSVVPASADLVDLEAVLGVTEFARDRDCSVGLAHVRQLVRTEAPEQVTHPVPRAATMLLQTDRGESAHAFVGKQPVEQPLRHKRRIEQLVILYGFGQGTGAGPADVLFSQQHVLVLIIGRHALLKWRDVLHEQAAGPPLPRASRIMAGNRQPEEGGDLL